MRAMNSDTAEHFYAWLNRTVRPDMQHEVEQAIHALLRSDPELVLSHSWPEMARMAGVPGFA